MHLQSLLGIGRKKLLSTGTQTTGAIDSVKVQYWCKVNTTAARRNSSDGAVYPAVITVHYCVDGQNYAADFWSSARMIHPVPGMSVTVHYDPQQPGRCAAVL